MYTIICIFISVFFIEIVILRDPITRKCKINITVTNKTFHKTFLKFPILVVAVPIVPHRASFSLLKIT